MLYLNQHPNWSLSYLTSNTKEDICDELNILVNIDNSLLYHSSIHITSQNWSEFNEY